MALKATVALLVVALAAGALARVPVHTQPEVEALPSEQAAVLLKELLRGAEAVEAEVAPFGVVESTVNKVLDQLRDVLREGMPSKGVPVLDPFQMSHLEGHMHKKSIIDFDGALDTFQVVGLSGFVVDKVKYNVLKSTFNFEMHMPNVTVTGTYNLTSDLVGILPIYGAGPIVITIADLQVTAKAKINLLSMSVKTLELDYTLGQYHSEFGGILGGGDGSAIINAVINDLVPEIVAGNEDIVTGLLEEVLLKIINSIL